MTISQFELEAAVKKTVKLYNRLKSPQAYTKIIYVLPELVLISFSGSFCYGCGDTQKYIEDFAEDFKIFVGSVELKAGKPRETSPRSFEVGYSIQEKK